MSAVTGPADLRDQRWLDEQVADLGRGIEAAQAIWENWWDGRQVGRLHPGQSAGEYIASLGMRLSLPEALAAMPDASTRQVAAVAGVSPQTVMRARVPNGTPVTGADGKTYPRVVREVIAEIIEVEEEPTSAQHRKRLTVTETRQHLRHIEHAMALLVPDELVPNARPLVLDALPRLSAWMTQWTSDQSPEESTETETP